MKLLANPEVKTIAVEHRDRLMRMGSEYVESALAAQGRRILVIDKKEVKDDLVQDIDDMKVSSRHGSLKQESTMRYLSIS